MRKKLAGGREGTSWDDLMKSREVQLPGEEVPDPCVGGTGLEGPHQGWAVPAPGTQPPGHRRLPRGSRLMLKLSSSEHPASRVVTAGPQQDTKGEISKRRGATAGEQVLRWGLEASSAHPGPSTGTPQRGVSFQGMD